VAALWPSPRWPRIPPAYWLQPAEGAPDPLGVDGLHGGGGVGIGEGQQQRVGLGQGEADVVAEVADHHPARDRPLLGGAVRGGSEADLGQVAYRGRERRGPPHVLDGEPGGVRDPAGVVRAQPGAVTAGGHHPFLPGLVWRQSIACRAACRTARNC